MDIIHLIRRDAHETILAGKRHGTPVPTYHGRVVTVCGKRGPMTSSRAAFGADLSRACPTCRAIESGASHAV